MDKMNKPLAVAIMGPTASGKTASALACSGGTSTSRVRATPLA